MLRYFLIIRCHVIVRSYIVVNRVDNPKYHDPLCHKVKILCLKSKKVH